jgi:hypothetical protein
MTFPEAFPNWQRSIQLCWIVFVLSSGCAKSQPNTSGPDDLSKHNELEDSFEFFEASAPDTSRLVLGNFEFQQVEGQPHHALIGNFEGSSQEIIAPADAGCLDVMAEQDLDGDGFQDILLRYNAACIGQCCLNSYFVVSYRGNGRYHYSEKQGASFRDPVVTQWNGKWSVIIENSPEATISTAISSNKQRFVLDGGELVKVEDIPNAEIAALKELRALAFEGADAADTLKMEFDLDADGKMDLIWGTFWKSRGRLRWSVNFGNGKIMWDGTPCKRLGILATKTEGLHELVVDQDRILEWTGKRFEERE